MGKLTFSADRSSSLRVVVVVDDCGMIARVRIGLILVLLLGAFAAGANAGVTLTDTRGREATVELTSVDGERIEFLLNGRPGKMRLDELEPDSRDRAIAAAKAAGIYESHPPMTVQVGVGQSRRNDDTTWYRKTIDLRPRLTVDGVNRQVPIPAMEATMVLIVMDTRKKYVERVEELEVLSSETIEIPAAGNGKRRTFDFSSETVSFDTARDTSNVGGTDYKYFIFALRDPETKRILNFQTNCMKLEKWVAAQPDQRKEFLELSDGKPFDEDF